MSNLTNNEKSVSKNELFTRVVYLGKLLSREPIENFCKIDFDSLATYIKKYSDCSDSQLFNCDATITGETGSRIMVIKFLGLTLKTVFEDRRYGPTIVDELSELFTKICTDAKENKWNMPMYCIKTLHEVRLTSITTMGHRYDSPHGIKYLLHFTDLQVYDTCGNRFN